MSRGCGRENFAEVALHVIAIVIDQEAQGHRIAAFSDPAFRREPVLRDSGQLPAPAAGLSNTKDPPDPSSPSPHNRAGQLIPQASFVAPLYPLSSAALKRHGEPTGVADFSRLASVINQADRFGTSIAPSLRTHSEYLQIVFPISFSSSRLRSSSPSVRWLSQMRDLLPIMENISKKAHTERARCR